MARVIETAARGAQLLLAIGVAYIIAIWFAIVAWTFRDIESRSRSVFTQVFATLLVTLFFVPGLMLYLILRPKETLDQAFQRALEEEYLLQDLDELPLCPGCHRAIDPEFMLCPHCQTRLREPCPSCSRLIDVRWTVCPYCAVPVDRSAQPDAIGIDSLSILEDARASRRRRAVKAAAQRVGIEPDELDAFADALSGSGRHLQVSPGSDVTAASPRPSVATWERPGIRARLSQLLPNGTTKEDGATAPAEGDDSNAAPRTSGFWSDPLPGQTRAEEPETRQNE
jgi:hypothetical protein